MSTPLRTRAQRALAAVVITGAVFAGSVATAPAANAIEYVKITKSTKQACVDARAAKITQLQKLGYRVTPGGCAQIFTSWIVKIGYSKK